MNIQLQIVIALILYMIIGYPVYFFLRRKYQKNKKSIKYLMFKVSCFCFPIVLVPFWLSDMTLKGKLILTLLSFGGAVGWYIALAEFRVRIRKSLGLAPDEDWEDPEGKGDTNESKRV